MDAEIFYIVVGAVAVAAIARWRGWPAPLLVTVVALAASFLPFIPALQIDGHTLLSVVLPPLLYSAALDSSYVSFSRSLPQIRRLGIGLVLVTAAAVGLVAWLLMPSLTLPGALLLGAIVAPPDAVSAAAIGRKLGLPRRIMTVLSGESLINDATSLTLYRVFAAIIAGATLSVWDGIWQFLVAVVVGVGVGLLFGVGLHQLRVRVSDPVVNGTFGLLAPFGAYAIAEHLLGSGVLAVVAMGLYVGYNSPATSYTTRLQEKPLWLSADFLLESFVFAYIGLQLPRVISEMEAGSTGAVLGLSLVVLLVVLIVRPIFVYPAHAWGHMWQRRRVRDWEQAKDSGRLDEWAARTEARGRRFRHPRTEKQMQQRLVERNLSWQDNAVISWAGMRGVVTLATAIAASDLEGLTTQAKHAIVVVAFVVTVGTLLLQGLTLPTLIRRLGIVNETDELEDAREVEAVRARSREAGKAYLRAQRKQWQEERGDVGVAAFDAFAKRLVRVESDAEGTRKDDMRPSYAAFATMSRGWLDVRRKLVVDERDAGNLNEEVMRSFIDELDAEELTLDTRGALHPPEPDARQSPESE